MKFVSRFDTNGVLYHIGTYNRTQPYRNPHDIGAVVVKASSLGGGDVRNVVGHARSNGQTYTSNLVNSWFSIDLGAQRRLIVDHYCFRSDTNETSTLRSWTLDGSVDGAQWHVLRTHVNDTSLAQRSHSEADWTVECSQQPYRYFRIRMTGVNAFGMHFLHCDGIELYGLLV